MAAMVVTNGDAAGNGGEEGKVSKYPIEVEVTLAQDRFMDAAIEFCRQDGIIRDLRRDLKPCEDRSRGDWETGEPASGPCSLLDEEEPRCGPCEERFQQGGTYRAALSNRRNAKARMVRWESKMRAEAQLEAVTRAAGITAESSTPEGR